jgi:hypothetical protein
MRHFLSILRAAALLAIGLLPQLEGAEPTSILSGTPDWADLAPYQKTITRAEFIRLLDSVYAPGGAWKDSIDLGKTSARVHQPESAETDFRLEFAPAPGTESPIPRYWSAPGSKKTLPGQPLAGYTIAIDPGHLGGNWAKMEERWFKIGEGIPVTEGDMALLTAKHLAERLTALGARVVPVRSSASPVTSDRPRTLRTEARALLARAGHPDPRFGYDGPNDPNKTESLQWQSELLFYRVSEIRARAWKVNQRIRPDLTICLHYNAEPWGNPANPQLTNHNHMHLLVNGNYGADELALADVRHEMLLRLLQRCDSVDVPLSAKVADSLARATGLPPFAYQGGNAASAGSPYVWARNLLANRLYQCPVVYCEPFVMNSQAVFDRVQLGDYEGTRLIGGEPRKSLYREYADAVAEGVGAYFAEKGK